jgi:hypothetical protein
MVPSPVNVFLVVQNFPIQFLYFLLRHFTDMGTGVVLVKDNSFSVDEMWTFFFKAFVYLVQLLTVNF